LIYDNPDADLKRIKTFVTPMIYVIFLNDGKEADK